MVRRGILLASILTGLGIAWAAPASVNIVVAPEALEDDDILEMVNAGLIDATVVDDYAAQFWKQVFPGLTLNTSAAVATGRDNRRALRLHGQAG